MSHFKSTPPSRDAGEISPTTKALRPSLGVDAKTCSRVRQYRRGRKLSDAVIATRVGVPVQTVREILAAMRTKNVKRSRATINATLAAGQFFNSEARPGEALWQTVDRVIDELIDRRSGVI